MNAPTVDLPDALRRYPELDAWIQIQEDGTIVVFSGKVEIGQGIRTVIAQIAAEELDVSLERIQVVLADTGRTPDEGYTAGSNSTQGSGGAVRFAAAEARQVLLELAAEHLAAPLERLTVHDGIIVDPVTENYVSYWELMGGRPFRRQVTGRTRPKDPGQYTLVGQPIPRLDIPAKVVGQPVFVDDMELPGMVHGRVVRPPAVNATLAAVDRTGVERLPGVLAVVQDGSFLGVVARREEQAVRAAEALRQAARWQGETVLPSHEEIFDHLRAAPAQSLLVVDGTPVDDPIPPVVPPAEAAQTLTATYYRPFLMHAALGPSSALAQWQDGRLTIWTHSQGVYPLRGALAQVLEMAPEDIRVIHVEGPGCYGHNGADDAALDAALLARATPGRPVLLKWSREDEHRWEPYGPAMAIQIQASLDAQGRVVDWNHDVWSYSHSGRPRPRADGSTLLAARHLARPILPPPPRPGRGRHGGSHRNADPLYTFPRRRIVKHFVADSPLRTSSLRSLGAFANVFAIESFMDELARAAQADPVAFRLRHLGDSRAGQVLQAAAERVGWQPGVRAGGEGQGRGRGIAFAQYKNEKCYAAVVVDLEVERESGAIRLQRITIAADAGQIINPDGLRNQLEGGAIQAASWALKEAVRFGPEGLASRDWQTYPILTFDEAPEVDVLLIDRPGEPPLGAGEATVGPTAAAIANAVFHAVGVRLRHMPFTPERVRAALQEEAS
ncbi:molybdopterin-dependent oxidoreductase [Litorilinea aerophila]|uniref:Xanthine dehydrogenase family protein molybdopterin-binding subunit n=1 Tax=Litorilinea aerophila TaxID=1204385 RepID=A0A540VME9_9CHLR|nr:molybdopterin cofactor-binding domain-containing protein [Litorilinea aerophila]MCC9074640.1 molybdopterin-dependent oxidoreductase [Litorilinea aerophila]